MASRAWSQDVAKVRIGGELRRGAASRDGYETVISSALMLVGENSRTVAHAVEEKLEAIEKTLPKGIVAMPTLHRSQLVVATITTVTREDGGVADTHHSPNREQGDPAIDAGRKGKGRHQQARRAEHDPPVPEPPQDTRQE